MSLRTRRSWAAIAALTVTAPALMALTVAPAGAATGGGSLLCRTTTLAPEQDAPFGLSVTADPAGPAAASGASVPVNNATVVLTLPGAVVGNLEAQAGATGIGLNQGIVKLDATHAIGSLQASNLAAAAQTITGYNATGGPGGTPTADPIVFTITGADFGSVTTAGANGDSVVISLAADSSADGFIFSLTSGIIPTLGFGSLNNVFGGPGGDGFCANDTLGANGPWAPSIASVALVAPARTTFTNSVRPSVAGRAVLGRRLTCRPGARAPRAPPTAVRGRRDGKAIRTGAAKARYRIVKADVRHRLSCKVTVTHAGYTRATATSARTRAVRRH